MRCSTPKTEEPRYLGQAAIGAGDVTAVKLFASNRNGADTLQARLDGLEIHAERIGGLGTAVRSIFGTVVYGEPIGFEDGLLLIGDAAPAAPGGPGGPGVPPGMARPGGMVAMPPGAVAMPPGAVMAAPGGAVAIVEAAAAPVEAETAEAAAPAEADPPETPAQAPQDAKPPATEDSAGDDATEDSAGDESKPTATAEQSGTEAEAADSTSPTEEGATPPEQTPPPPPEPKAKIPLVQIDRIRFERTPTPAGRFLGQPNIDLTGTAPGVEKGKDDKSEKDGEV